MTLNYLFFETVINIRLVVKKVFSFNNMSEHIQLTKFYVLYFVFYKN